MWNVSASYPQVVCKCAFPEPIGSELASSMSCSNGSNRSSTITWGSCFGLKWRRQKQSWSMCMELYIYIDEKKKNTRKIWKAHIDTLQILAKFPQITQRRPGHRESCSPNGAESAFAAMSSYRSIFLALQESPSPGGWESVIWPKNALMSLMSSEIWFFLMCS